MCIMHRHGIDFHPSEIQFLSFSLFPELNFSHQERGMTEPPWEVLHGEEERFLCVGGEFPQDGLPSEGLLDVIIISFLWSE